jgi:cobalt-zinc-cadmium efflux system membrane fusion protein
MRIPLISCLVLASVAAGCDAGKQQPPRSQVTVSGDTLTVPANSPQRAALTIDKVGPEQSVFVPLTGRLVWNDDATARVFTPFAGIVRKLLVEVNEPVTNGMPLAEMQSAEFGQAQAEARKSESDFRRAERNLTRSQELFEHGAAPRKDLEGAEADFASTQAEKDRAEGRLAIYGVLASSTNRDFLLPSPLQGVLVERNVTPGQEIRPDQMLANVPQFTAPLFTISDPTRLWVWLDVTEAFLPLVHKGQELTVRSRAFPDQTFKGKLDLISDSLDPTTRTVRARGTVDNASRTLKAEQYVTVEIPDSRPTSLLVPSKAVFLRDNQYYVFLESGEGRFQRQPVKVGSEREGKVAILEGLKEGQRLVIDGCLLLQSLMDNAPKS